MVTEFQSDCFETPDLCSTVLFSSGVVNLSVASQYCGAKLYRNGVFDVSQHGGELCRSGCLSVASVHTRGFNYNRVKKAGKACDPDMRCLAGHCHMETNKQTNKQNKTNCEDYGMF